jgi:sugar lactone lactonase YvrE
MREPSDTNYLYLNREGRWPGFRHHGLERRADGALQLATVPLLSGTLPDAVKAAPIPDGPAGVASDSLGTLYFSDPGKHRLTRIDGCDGSVAPVPCLGAGTGAPTSVRYPRGLWISPARPSLFVADSGNHRVQIFDLDTLQLVAIWGQANPGATPRPGSQPGQFDTPWSLAGDGSGNVYVVDYGNRRVQKFNAVGDVLPSFWNNVRASGLLQYPSDVAVREYDGTNWVFVVDAASSKIFVFDGDGQPVPGAYGRARAIVDDHLTRPMGVAAAGDALYVGDNDARRVLRFHIGARFEYVGEAVGYTGPVAALWLDARGALWVHPGGSLAPVRLEPRGGYGTLGHLWSEQPLQVQDRTVVWHRLQAVAERLAPNAHLNLYVYGSNDPQPPESPTAANSFTDAKWRSVAYAPDLDLNDVYIGGAEARYLWIGALLSGDGVVTPMLRQLRVEFDHA